MSLVRRNSLNSGPWTQNVEAHRLLLTRCSRDGLAHLFKSCCTWEGRPERWHVFSCCDRHLSINQNLFYHQNNRPTCGKDEDETKYDTMVSRSRLGHKLNHSIQDCELSPEEGTVTRGVLPSELRGFKTHEFLGFLGRVASGH